MTSGTVVGSLFARLGLDSADYEAGLDRADRGAKTFAKNTAATFKGVSANVATAAASMRASLIGIGFAGAFVALKDAASDFASIAAEAKKAGIAVEAFQELRYAAQQSQVGLDALTDGLKELQLRADEFAVTGKGAASEAFQRLGISATDLKGKLAEPEALFEEIINKLGALDKAAQIRISDEIFGGTGGEQFVRFLDQGVGYIGRMRTEARDTGNVFSKEFVQQAVEIERQFQRVATTISVNVKGAIVSVAGATSTWLDMLNRTQDQQVSTLQARVAVIDALVAKTKTSTMAYYAAGGEDGINERLRERATLLEMIDRLQNKAALGMSYSGPPASLPTTPSTGGASGTSEAEQRQQQLAQRIDALRQTLATEEEMERQSNQQRLDDLKEAFETGVIPTRAEYDELIERQAQEHSDRMVEIARRQAEEEDRIRKQLVKYTADTLGSLADLANAFGEKGFKAAKAFGIGQAVINTAEGITEALTLPFPMNFAAAASVAAAGAAQIATIASAQPGSSSRPSVSSGAVPDTSSGGAGDSAAPGNTAYVDLRGLGSSRTYSDQDLITMMERFIELQRDGYKIVLSR